MWLGLNAMKLTEIFYISYPFFNKCTHLFTSGMSSLVHHFSISSGVYKKSFISHCLKDKFWCIIFSKFLRTNQDHFESLYSVIKIGPCLHHTWSIIVKLHTFAYLLSRSYSFSIPRIYAKETSILISIFVLYWFYINNYC